ncbi:MAG: metallophosphoesterase, partial [Candidatus Pacebacteria bacterium]|nr:metallophosphoesterase [Candidatus Paceibacterota bacterium]
SENKKKQMKKMLIIFILLIIIVDIFFEVNFPKINEVSLESDKVKEDIRIIQISDLHDKIIRDDFIEAIKNQNPDFIVITGDLIDRRTSDYNNVYSFIEKLAPFPIYCISGNHDLSHKDVTKFNQELSKRGVIVLNEKSTSYKGIDLYGFEYYSSFNNLKAKTDVFSLALVHNPMDIVEKDTTFDLILSGHTHGGQVRFPFVGAIFIPGQGLFAKYDKGLFQINEKTKLYIDSGLGNTFLPIRFLNRSQVSLIRIYSK